MSLYHSWLLPSLIMLSCILPSHILLFLTGPLLLLLTGRPRWTPRSQRRADSKSKLQMDQLAATKYETPIETCNPTEMLDREVSMMQQELIEVVRLEHTD